MRTILDIRARFNAEMKMCGNKIMQIHGTTMKYFSFRIGIAHAT